MTKYVVVSKKLHDTLKHIIILIISHFDGLVKVIRQPVREGLVQARLAGAAAAIGDVLPGIN